jgi:cysteine desulfurase/selenocysteine lyase
MLDVGTIRDDFPIFKRKIRGYELVFLDSAASSQKPKVVIDEITKFYEHSYANIHRGLYVLSMESTSKYDQARERIARFVNASPDKYYVVFVRGTTEAINLMAQSYGMNNVGAGDEILITEMEHHANLVPWQLVAQQRGATLKVAEVDEHGVLDLNHFWDQVTDKTRIVAMTHASNVLGTINPIEDLLPGLHERGIITVIDGAQAAPAMPVDVDALGCTAYAFSAHKMLGPTGVGALIIQKDIADQMPPYQTGGGMVRKVTFQKTSFANAPERFEAGTPSFAEIPAFGTALDYLDGLGMKNILAHEQNLVAYALRKLKSVPGIKIFGPEKPGNRLGVVSFVLDGLHAHDLGMFLDFQGICVRVGHHCAQPLLTKLGTTSTIRASMYVYNTPKDIDRLQSALRDAIDYFKVPT